jgi:hypothetical protein
VSTIPAARPATRLTAPKLVIGLNAGLAVAALLLWTGMAIRGEFWRADFSAFYTGWAMVLDGHGDHLYDFAWQSEYQARLVPGRGGPDGLLPYVYPPQFIVCAPLALLPLPIAFYVWTALQAGLLALTLRWLCDDARAWGPAAPGMAVATLLAFQPVFLTFQLGQQALISLVAIYGLGRALRDQQPLTAGAWLALASLKPQLALLPAIFLLGACRWRILGFAVGLFAVWAGAATVVLGWRCWLDFLALASFHARQFDTYGVFPLRGHNLKMVFAALFGPERLPLINALTTGGLLLAAGIVLLLGWTSRTADRPARGLCFALTILLGVLTAPHLNPHDALLLVVPAVLLLDAVHQRGEATFALSGVLATCPLLFWADSFAMEWWPSRVRPFLFVIIGLTFWAGRELLRKRPIAEEIVESGGAP